MSVKNGPRCVDCPLREERGPVWGVGPQDAKLAIIGQNPGPDEIEAGEPFIGSSGRLLNRGLFEVGIKREACFISNIVKCFVQPGKPIPWKAVECCRPLLYQELGCLPNLRVKVSLGIEAFNALSGKHLHLQHNRKAAVKDPSYWMRGYPFRSSTTEGCPLIPLEHPSSIMRGGFLSTPYWQSDWRKVKRWYDGGGKIYKETYNYTPSARQVEEYIDAILLSGRCGVDIETPESVMDEEEVVGREATPIDVVGLSNEVGDCIGVPPDLIPLLGRLFSTERKQPLVVFAYNWGFEHYHLSKRFDLSRVRAFDLMLALHVLYPDARPKDLGMALSMWTDIPYHKNLQKFQPDLYNARDTYGALWGGLEAWESLKSMQCEAAFWSDMDLIPLVEDIRTIGIRCDTKYANFAELSCYKKLSVYEKWWQEHIPTASWTAPQQLAPIFRKMGMPVILRERVKKDKLGNKTKTKTPSLDEEVLEEYRDKYHNQLAGLILEMRRLKHAADFTHLFLSDGRSHPQYKIHGQVGSRLQAKDPDLQNIPEEAAGTNPRKIIVGDTSNDVIINADFSQIELWIYAYCANDVPFLLAKERGDYIYGQLYEEIFPGEPFFIPGKPRTKKFRHPDVAPWKLLVAKSGPLGWIYGRGPASMANLGVSIAKGKEIYERLAREHHAILDFHSRLEYEVNRSGLLRNLFGRIRRFPNPRGQRNEFLAFPGQTNATDVLRLNALHPLRAGLPRYGARLLFTVHDSVIVSCPRRTARECAQFIKQTMESPIAQMNGFWIPVSVSIGPNWNDLTDLEKWNEDPLPEQSRVVESVQAFPERTQAQP